MLGSGVFITAGLLKDNVPVLHVLFIWIVCGFVGIMGGVLWANVSGTLVKNESKEGGDMMFFGSRTQRYGFSELFFLARVLAANPMVSAAISSICVGSFFKAFNFDEIQESSGFLETFLYIFLCILVNFCCYGIIVHGNKYKSIICFLNTALKLKITFFLAVVGLYGSYFEVHGALFEEQTEATLTEYSKVFLMCLFSYNGFSKLTNLKSRRTLGAGVGCFLITVLYGLLNLCYYGILSTTKVGFSSFVFEITKSHVCRRITDFCIGLVTFGSVLDTAYSSIEFLQYAATNDFRTNSFFKKFRKKSLSKSSIFTAVVTSLYCLLNNFEILFETSIFLCWIFYLLYAIICLGNIHTYFETILCKEFFEFVMVKICAGVIAISGLFVVIMQFMSNPYARTVFAILIIVGLIIFKIKSTNFINF